MIAKFEEIERSNWSLSKTVRASIGGHWENFKHSCKMSENYRTKIAIKKSLRRKALKFSWEDHFEAAFYLNSVWVMVYWLLVPKFSPPLPAWRFNSTDSGILRLRWRTPRLGVLVGTGCALKLRVWMCQLPSGQFGILWVAILKMVPTWDVLAEGASCQWMPVNVHLQPTQNTVYQFN